MANYIEEKEINLQKEYINKLKEYTENFRKRYKRAPHANTETYGCQQNENDTERIRGVLSEAGYEFTDTAEDADLVIYNTCAVRENAELKIFGNIGKLKALKAENPDMIVAVCGCMVMQQHIVDKIKKTMYNNIRYITLVIYGGFLCRPKSK